jgi:hypothetical protein
LAGEVPFTQVFPELWVVEARDLERARKIIADYQAAPGDSDKLADWVCPNCHETVDGGYAECWNCGTEFPSPV